MEAPYVVGVGGVSAGAEQRGEGRAQLHGEGLLWTTGDPVWVGVWHQTALDQLADTWEGVTFTATGVQSSALTGQRSLCKAGALQARHCRL
jgi:hypothetical protein